MTSENVAEQEAVESAAAVSAKAVDDQLIDELVGRAQAEGLQLTDEGGLLQQLTKRLLESALEGEITDHLGYDKHDPAGKDGGNSRNGLRHSRKLRDQSDVYKMRTARSGISRTGSDQLACDQPVKLEPPSGFEPETYHPVQCGDPSCAGLAGPVGGVGGVGLFADGPCST